MRAIFVNYAHPLVPHVSGLRVSQFADALARKGHQVVLLTATLQGETSSRPPDKVCLELEMHDWSRPYHLACPPRPDRWLTALRSGRLPKAVRRFIILWYYLFRTGVFNDWVEGTRSYWLPLVKTFQPQVTWGTFGNTDTWAVARGIASLAHIPWIMDIKDGWNPFIPSVLRNHLARRFHDAAALTVNSRFQANLSQRWFSHEPVILYSGVPSFFLKRESTDIPREGFRLTLVGSIYSEENLGRFLAGIRDWLLNLDSSDRRHITFTYAGGDAGKVKQAGLVLDGLCHIKIHHYLGLEKLFELYRSSTVNAYLWSPTTFHHKLVELLCCGRPIISFPGETAEALELAQEVNEDLNPCTTTYQLTQCLQRIWLQPMKMEPSSDGEPLRRFSWDAQGERLLTVLKESLKSGN